MAEKKKSAGLMDKKANVVFVLNSPKPTFRNNMFIATHRNMGQVPLVILHEQNTGAPDGIKKSELGGVKALTINTAPGKGMTSRYKGFLKKALAQVEEGTTVYINHISHLRLRFKKARLVYDVTEASIPATEFKIKQLNNIARLVLEFLEARYVRSARVSAVTISGPRSGELAKFKKACENSEVVLTVPAKAQSAIPEEKALAAKKIGGKRIVAVMGGFSSLEDLDYSLEVASNVISCYDDVLFLFMGQTALPQETFKRAVAKRNLDGKVHYLKGLTYKKMMAYLENAHVGLALQRTETAEPDLTEENSMRFFTYMHAGLPVVGPSFIEESSVAQGAGCGLFVNTSSPVDVSGAVAYLLTHPDAAKAKAAKGRETFAKRYNWEHEKNTLIRLVEQQAG